MNALETYSERELPENGILANAKRAKGMNSNGMLRQT